MLHPEVREPAHDSLLCCTTVDNINPYCTCIAISALALAHFCTWVVCLRPQHDELFVVSSSRSSGTPHHVPIDFYLLHGQLFSAARDCVFATHPDGQPWCAVKYPGDHEVYGVEMCVLIWEVCSGFICDWTGSSISSTMPCAVFNYRMPHHPSFEFELLHHICCCRLIRGTETKHEGAAALPYCTVFPGFILRRAPYTQEELLAHNLAR